VVALLALRGKLAVIGAALLAVLAFFVRLQSVKNQRDKARTKAEVLGAVVHAERTKKRIKEEERKKGVSRRDTIEKRTKELEEGVVKGEDFEGVDNLTDPNKY